MITNEDEKLKAAYALNLCTVSVSQIVDYNDLNILEQEYDTIINNLNLENIPKNQALLDILKEILDEITYARMNDGDRKIMERRYQHQLKNAVWSAVPNVGAIFATSDRTAMGIALATQVGIGYMNYRRNKAEYELGYEESKWQIAINRIQHFNALRKQLFETAWKLAEAYEFPNRYRLTEKVISMYNEALMENNPVKRYHKLDDMKSEFDAYPVFWYQIGSTANSIYRSDLREEVKSKYKALAIENFERYERLNKFNLLKHDLLTASWALEYLELLDVKQNDGPGRAKELLGIAERYAGNALDVIELCAFSYLRIGDDDNAVKAFHKLVNNSYNEAMNTQILSALYIKQIYKGNAKQSKEAQMGYEELHNIAEEKYILELPPKGADLSSWKPEWNREESMQDFLEKQKEEQKRKKEDYEETKKKARTFYQRPLFLVYSPAVEDVAEYFKGVLDENREKLGDYHLPYASKVVWKEYIQRRNEYEQSGTHIIMLGEAEEAKKLYKTYLKIKGERWDCADECYQLGIRYISYSTNTILLVRPLKDEQIDDLICLADSIHKRHPIRTPKGVKSVKYTVLKDCYQNQEIFDKKEELITDVLAAVATAPFAALAQVKELVENGIQWGKNLSAASELRFLQYCIAIYKYLESENAIVD